MVARGGTGEARPNSTARRRARDAGFVIAVVALVASIPAALAAGVAQQWALVAVALGVTVASLLAALALGGDEQAPADVSSVPPKADVTLEALADAPPTDFSPEQAERFWRSPFVRLQWAALMLFDLGGYFAALLGGVLLGGDNFLAALGISGLLLVPVLLVSAVLHRLLDIPWMSPIPPRTPPAPAELPRELTYRPGVFKAALMPLAIAFVVLLFGAIVLGEGRRQPDPAIGRQGTVVTVALTGLGVACAIAIFVRSRRMRLQVGPEGVRIFNFWSSRLLRWDEIERVYAARSAGLTATVAVASGVGDVDLPHARSLRIQPKMPGAPSIGVGVRLFTDVHRDARFQQVLVALRREAEAHGVPVDF